MLVCFLLLCIVYGNIQYCILPKPVLGGVRDIAFFSIFHEQTQQTCGSLLFLLSVFILWFIYYVSDIFCKF